MKGPPPSMARRRADRATAPRRARGFLLLAPVVGTLVLFHVFLLCRRIADASILSPRVLLNWLAAFALVAALLRMRRRGHSPMRGRGALTFWLLVLLLHAGPALQPAPGLPPSGAESLPSPSSILTAFLWTTLLAAALAAAAPARRPQAPLRGLPSCLATADGFGRVVAPRPPPFALAS